MDNPTSRLLTPKFWRENDERNSIEREFNVLLRGEVHTPDLTLTEPPQRFETFSIP